MPCNDLQLLTPLSPIVFYKHHLLSLAPTCSHLLSLALTSRTCYKQSSKATSQPPSIVSPATRAPVSRRDQVMPPALKPHHLPLPRLQHKPQPLIQPPRPGTKREALDAHMAQTGHPQAPVEHPLDGLAAVAHPPLRRETHHDADQAGPPARSASRRGWRVMGTRSKLSECEMVSMSG